MTYEDSLVFAKKCDQEDELGSFRQQFYIPEREGKELIYLCGNSLGLQPKTAADFINAELQVWQERGVEGHFTGSHPWADYHLFLKETLAKLVGAQPSEVVAMNGLTVNLHLMMVSFYQPLGTRFKILIEAGAFPSDQYAVESQIRFHGYDPAEAIVELTPRPGEELVRTEDALALIQKEGDAIALVLLPGVQYYTGQKFDIEKLTKAGHAAGAKVGVDLAHAIGNVPLQLHDWKVDFGVWCSYKYLNSGPGGISGIFVHQKFEETDLPRFAGWWGHDAAERFKMKKGFKPMSGADGWQLSNKNVLSLAVQRASLAIFERAGLEKLIAKSVKLTGYLEFLLKKRLPQVQIITPSDSDQRGCQLSLCLVNCGKTVFDKISKKGVIADWREPNVIRIAPVPLYNSFEEVYRFVQILEDAL